MQQLTTKTPLEVVVLGRLISAHSALTGELTAQLVAEHGLTMSELEVLLLLERAEERAMRRVDLAREVRLSPSGITRLLDRLEASGFVEKGACKSDARVTYAILTDAGFAKLRECIPGHFDAIERRLSESLDEEALESLAQLLAQLSDDDDEACDEAAELSRPEAPARTG
jgi:DNA-binding MarR family transcriptional regulator